MSLHRKTDPKPRLTCRLGLWLTFCIFWLTILSLQPLSAAPDLEGVIVFSLGGMLSTINPDGSNPQSLGIEGETPKWSPDGTQIVFARRYNDKANRDYGNIFIVNANGLSPRPLAPIPLAASHVRLPWSDLNPVWSPDGVQIAFDWGLTQRDICVMDVIDGTGGTFKRLTRSPDRSEVSPSWSPDRKKMVYLSNGHFFTIDVEDQQVTQLTDTNLRREGPVWSPDGKQLAFAATIEENDGTDNVDIYIYDIESKVETRLTTDIAVDRAPSWSPEGKQIVFEREHGKFTQLHRLTIESGEVVQLTHNASPARSPDWILVRKPPKFPSVAKSLQKKILFRFRNHFWTRNLDGNNIRRLNIKGEEPHLSPDGTRIVFKFQYQMANDAIRSKICVADVDGNNPHVLVPHVLDEHLRFRNPGSPVWSPNGRLIAFYTQPYGRFEIYAIDTSGETIIKVISLPYTSVTPLSWSPDGHQIAFHSKHTGDTEIYVVDVLSGDLTNLTDSPDTSDSYPLWSPDGKKIAYSSNGLNVIDLEAKDKTLLNTMAEFVGQAAWSEDGTRLAYAAIRHEGNTISNRDIYIMDIKNHVETRLTTHPASDGSPSWTADDTEILFFSNRNEDSNLYRITIASGAIEQLTNGL